MKSFDRISHKDSLLSQHIEAVKLALQKLEPNLQSLHSQEVLKSEYKLQISNRGLFEIKLDIRAVIAVFEACGINQEDLDDIHIVFRAGKLADRNLHGQLVAGLRIDSNTGGHQIEVYTSLPHLSFQQDGPHAALSQTKIINFASSWELLSTTFLEEIRHVIQEKLTLFDMNQGSFDVADVEELRRIDYEADAEKFTSALVQFFAKFIRIEKYANPELAEMYVDDVDIDLYIPRELQRFFMRDMIAQVQETDPLGVFLLQELNSIDPLDENAVNALIKITVDSVYDRQLGFVEARWILSQLNQKVTAVGNIMSAFEVQAKLQELS